MASKGLNALASLLFTNHAILIHVSKPRMALPIVNQRPFQILHVDLGGVEKWIR